LLLRVTAAVKGRTRLLLPRDRAALLLAVLWLTSILPAAGLLLACYEQLNQLITS
jgi:hypothetical protein